MVMKIFFLFFLFLKRERERERERENNRKANESKKGSLNKFFTQNIMGKNYF
jgi:hypothetical protein